MSMSVCSTAFLLMSLAMSASGIDENCPYQKCDCYDDAIHCFFAELKKLPPLHNVNSTKSLSLFFNGNFLSNIPAGGLPPRLSSINFEQNPIKTIDQDAFSDSADTLTQLLFSGALFTELPAAFLRLNNLTHLEVTDTQITAWNLNIVQHIGATLQILILNNIGLTSWPSWIQYLPHLSTLELSGASIFVPDNAFDKQINTLSSLNLANGILTEIPSAVSKLTQLQSLVLDYNNISRIIGIPNSSKLSTLSINENKLSDAAQLSQTLRSYSGSLKELQLSNNSLTYLPDLVSLTALEIVHLSDNAITYIGSSKMPSSLKYLDFDQNSLQSLDSFLRNAQSLNVLYVDHNAIKEILGVDIPVSVEHMDISYNLITELTDESFPLNSSLHTLNLDYNPITKVSSKAFSGLRGLGILSMGYTKITRLPVSFTSLASATMIDVSNSDNLVCTCLEKDVLSWSVLHYVDFYGDCGVATVHDFAHTMLGQCPD